ncbi:MAG: minor capsid protein, partial [Bacillota bacterium]|nr:minor capsid protein [Bacillota bacterium]
MTSKEYWKERALKREAAASRKGEELLDEVLRSYKKAHRENLRSIAEFYTKFADKHNLSHDAAFKTLNRKEFREFKNSLGYYVERIKQLPEGPDKKRLMLEIDALSTNSQITRLEALNKSIEANIAVFSAENTEKIKKGLESVYTDAYYRTVFDFQKGIERIFPFEQLTHEAVKSAVAFPWSGANFSKRWTENNRRLAYILEQEITQGVINGKSIAAMSKSIADQTGKSYKMAERLIRTESNHAHNDATLKGYAAAGVEYYEFVATLDYLTSNICGSLDGSIYKISEAQPGTNYPPMHPNCRSTTVMHDPDEWQDWDAIGEKMPKRTTYSEWKTDIDKRNGEGWFDAERKSVRQGDLDRAQHAKYRLIFGDRIPESYQDFMTLKYHYPDKWDIIKSEKTDAIKMLEYSPKLDGSLGNSEVRVWYKNKVSDIPNRVDKS